MEQTAAWTTVFSEVEQQMEHTFNNGLKMVISLKLNKYWLATQDGKNIESGMIDSNAKDWEKYLIAIAQR